MSREAPYRTSYPVQGLLLFCCVDLSQVWRHSFCLCFQLTQRCLMVLSCLLLLLFPLVPQLQQLLLPLSIYLKKLFPQLVDLVLHITDNLKFRTNKVKKTPKPAKQKPLETLDFLRQAVSWGKEADSKDSPSLFSASLIALPPLFIHEYRSPLLKA